MFSLNKQPVIYVSRDIERALGFIPSQSEGFDPDTPGYFIISNYTDFAKQATKKRKNVLLVKEKKMLDTWELLQHPKTKLFVNSPLIRGGGGGVGILVFKNTPQIEKICAENNWKLLNPPAELTNKVEEKIPQIEWLGPLKKYLPGYEVQKCKNIKFINKKFILQFNRSHTGSGTILIESKKQLDEIKKTFPEREARIARYIAGPLFTNNNIVSKNKILIGNINYQITGLKPFTDRPFATVGNDWALPHKILSKKQIRQYKKIALDVGQRLQKDGWRGLFGIDVVIDKKTGKLFLLEINCRQPASAVYESHLQMSVIPTERKRVEGSLKQCKTTFEAHLMALLGMDLKKYKLIEIKNGAQIIQRNTKHKIDNIKHTANKLQKAGFNTIAYPNTEPNSDLLRIQSKNGIMSSHNEFNAVGKKIIKILKIK